MQDAHNDYDITDFHGALLDIISVMNQPKNNPAVLRLRESDTLWNPAGTDAVSAACGSRAPWPGGGG